MNSKERLFNNINGVKTDRQACICPGGMMNMIITGLMEESKVYLPAAHSDAHMMADLAKQAYISGCFENIGVPFCMTVEAEEMGAKINMGSDIIEPHVSQYVIGTVSDYKRLDNKKYRSDVVVDAIKILKAEMPEDLWKT